MASPPIQTSDTFELSHDENKFKSCSTAALSITFILFIGYILAKFIYNKKTTFGEDVSFMLT